MISITNDRSLGMAKGTLLLYEPTNRGGNLSWLVSSGSTVPTKYRPKN
jgi:hypothetical protein